MRKLFWILLLANVVLFAAAQRGWLEWGEPMPQAQPALSPDMIRLLDTPQSAPHTALPASAATPSSTSVPASTTAAPPPVTTTKPATLACFEWGEFTGLDLSHAADALASLQLGNKLSQYQIEHDTGYWVYIPSLKNKAAVNQKVAELKARGITEYFVVQNADQWRNAISLGVFKTQEAAQKFMDEMRSKKVRSAQIGQRASKFKVTLFRLNEIGILTEAKLTAMQKDFVGSELKRIPCATLTR